MTETGHYIDLKFRLRNCAITNDNLALYSEYDWACERNGKKEAIFILKSVIQFV